MSTHWGAEAVDVYPKYQIGEKVAIAQSYATLLCELGVMFKRTDSGSVPVKVQDNVDFTKGDFIIDSTKIPKQYEAVAIQAIRNKTEIIDNKMFVRADLMPHVIEITDIKAERLLDISDEDCLREGIFYYKQPQLHHEYDRYAPWPPYVKPYKYDCDNLKYFCTPRAAFAALIDRLNGRGTWERNKWQFAYTFKLIK